MQLLYCILVGKLFTIAVGSIYYKNFSNAYRLALLLTGLATCCEIYGFYLSHICHNSNIWMFNLYMITEVFLLVVMATYLVDNRRLKIFFSAVFVIDFIFWLVNVLRNSIYVFAGSSMMLGCIFMTTIYIIVLFNNSLFNNKNIFIQPVFWLSLSSILYFGCDIPIMGMHNFLWEKMQKIATKLGDINTILDIFRFPFIGISFLLLGLARKKTNQLNTV